MRDSARGLPDHVLAAEDPAVLAGICGTGVTLALWQRALAPPLARMVDRLDLGAIADIRLAATPAELPEQLAEACATAGYGAGVDALYADVAALARSYAAIMDVSRIELRLEVVETDACRKFHADYVTARLITSYAGPGTQWLDHDAAAVHATGAPLPDAAIRQLARGDVALMKGRLWAGEDALVHRSPPIAGTGARRLLLVLNPAEPMPDAT